MKAWDDTFGSLLLKLWYDV